MTRENNIAFGWRPDSDVLVIHKVHIIRGDQVIDLLANGQTFTILRRETGLEEAMLDGRLTATLQPEGLQVGDNVVTDGTDRLRDGAKVRRAGTGNGPGGPRSNANGNNGSSSAAGPPVAAAPPDGQSQQQPQPQQQPQRRRQQANGEGGGNRGNGGAATAGGGRPAPPSQSQ